MQADDFTNYINPDMPQGPSTQRGDIPATAIETCDGKLFFYIDSTENNC